MSRSSPTTRMNLVTKIFIATFWLPSFALGCYNACNGYSSCNTQCNPICRMVPCCNPCNPNFSWQTFNNCNQDCNYFITTEPETETETETVISTTEESETEPSSIGTTETEVTEPEVTDPVPPVQRSLEIEKLKNTTTVQCCTIVIPCITENCNPYTYRCSNCKGDVGYLPINPCSDGCYKRKIWKKRVCYFQNCVTEDVDCTNCTSEAFKSFDGYKACNGCFYKK